MKYTAIRSEGGLLPYDLLDEILAETAPGQKAPDFGLPKGRRVSDEIQRVWLDAQELWSRFKVGREKLSDKDPHGTTLTRDRWIGPILTDPVRLSYDLHFQPSALVLDGLTFAISHRAGEPSDSPPVHIEGCGIELDKRPQKYRVSPQAMVQEFLNRSESLLWGVVTNGLRFRLLRDSVRTARPTYLEFDLETILEGGHYNEFVLFYRLCHRTRLPQAGRPSEDCWLEKYYQLSVEKGGRVRDNLRDGVEEALKVLGTGFLRHPENTALQENIDSGKLNADQYHRQLLLLVYRLLFLTVAEDRHLVVSIGENAVRNQAIYQDNYSIGKLRERAEGLLEDSGFCDLWVGLTQTFKLYADSNNINPLGIPPLNGDLFSHTTVPDLEAAQLSNLDLLKAIRWLMFYRERNVRQRVNYAALDVEELGSVYESLLDFRPMIVKNTDGRKFELGVGSERKTTGSYYTRPELVRELIQSALVPVLEDRLAEVEKQTKGQNAESIRTAKAKAIQGISVCDPACGSGHFLLEAARRLGKELARIRVGEDEPTPEQFHVAVRDVISHCIYGVDQNPLAVDLCKLALWLEGHWAGKPLSFLDHRIRCGNSLIGVLDPAVLADGICDNTFIPVAGDDKKVAAAFKRRNRNERAAAIAAQKTLVFEEALGSHLTEYASLGQRLTEMQEDHPAEVKRKGQIYQESRANVHWFQDSEVANAWTAAFFSKLNSHNDPTVPTHETFIEFLQQQVRQPRFVPTTQAIAVKLGFFHWFLEFPEVFQNGGFDAVLGNPPWELLQPEEIKFFASIGATRIAGLSGAKRKEAIEQLRETDPVLSAKWHTYERDIEAANKFIREGGRFDKTAVGKLNTYSLFAEAASALINENGRAGIIVQSGIATDDSNKEFFRSLNDKQALFSLHDFENREKLFPAVDSRMKFCLLTIGHNKTGVAEFAFFLTRAEHIRDDRRHFTLSGADLALLNPNTRTCPIFRTRADAELTKKIYRRVPVLVNEINGENPWGIRFQQGLFNMTSDSHLFYPDPGQGLLPLYEAKMIHQFDHRFATYENGEARDCTDSEKANPSFTIRPRYWVSQTEVETALAGWKRGWFLGFRDITNATNERTSIFSLVPKAAIGNNLPLVFTKVGEPRLLACLLANLNSLIFDYVTRQKVGGTHMNFFIASQLPALAPDSYTKDDVSEISRRVLELVYTSTDLESFAQDAGFSNQCFRWDQGRRAQLRAELDAYYAHLYELTRSELQYVLDPKDVFGEDFPSETFRGLRENEQKRWGEYRTQRLVLAAYDEFAKTSRFLGENRESSISQPKSPSAVPIS